MKIVSIVGARPQFIKAAPLSRVLRKEHDEILVHTGQHYDTEMSQVFFEELEMPMPDHNLGVGSGTHAYQTGQMMMRIEDVLLKEKPELVIIYGDTNSTVAGSLAATKLHIPVGHVEAGLRNFDMRLPEEINRIVADHLSRFNFAPTKAAVDHLEKEGLHGTIYHVGDVMLDALLYNRDIAEKKSGILEDVGVEPKSFILATIHRPDNTDNPENLENIVNAFIECGETVVFPAHPRTVKELKKRGLYEKLEKADSVKLIKPLGYLDFLKMMKNAKKVVTDSGGVQKETYLLKVPCITVYETTSWMETIEDGWNILVPPEKDGLVDAIKNFEPKGEQKDHFGGGRACERIADILRTADMTFR